MAFYKDTLDVIDCERLLDQHGRAVWLIGYRILGNADDAEEILQDVFLGAWQLGRRKAVGNWGAFLRCRATSRALDRLRKRKRHREVTADFQKWPELPADCPEPGELAEKSELADRLRQALAELPAQQAEAFCLCCVEGMMYREAAGAMNLKSATVGVLIHRARARLKSLIGHNARTSAKRGRP